MFSLNAELLNLQENQLYIEHEVLLNEQSRMEQLETLQDLMVRLKSDPCSILDLVVFDSCRSFVKYLPDLDSTVVVDFVHGLCKSIDATVHATAQDILENSQHQFESDKFALEMLLFVWHWLIDACELLPVQKDKHWDWNKQRELVLDSVHKLVMLSLDRIFIATAERDLLISMIYKSLSLMLESPSVVKTAAVKDSIIEILCHCASSYATGIQALKFRVCQEYLGDEHLADFVAGLLDNAVVNYNFNTLSDLVLSDIGSRDYNDKDKSSKAISKFLITYSETQPKEILKNMVHLNDLLDSESYTIRSAMVQVLGNIIHFHLVKDDSEQAAKNLGSFFEIIIQRFLDTNPYVRTRVLKILSVLTQRHENNPGQTDIPLSTRHTLVNLTSHRLLDKSSLVRRRAIELLVDFIQTSPFIAVADDKGTLNLKYFEQRVVELTAVIKEMFPVDMFVNDSQSPEESASMLDNSSAGEKQLQNAELYQLQKLLVYYQDGAKFIGLVESTCKTMCELLSSTVKSEVVAAMKFFVVCHRFDMEIANTGVLAMVHKIWEKDTSDSEHGSIKEHLIKSFHSMLMDPPHTFSNPNEKVANDLLFLVAKMDFAQLTSLEQLIITMVNLEQIPKLLPETLWNLFCSKQNDHNKRKHALVLLGMMGMAKKSIISDNLHLVTKIGLGELAKDLQVAKYACIAIQKMCIVKHEKGSLAPPYDRKPANHITIQVIIDLMMKSSGVEWFGFAEQAISAIYCFVQNPDKVCTELIAKMTCRVFSVSETAEDQIESLAKNLVGMNIDGANNQSIMSTESRVPISYLAQLIYIVGHVAMKQIVYLEQIESEYKRLKAMNISQKTKDDLEMVTGSAEDEFMDRMQFVKEKELLYGSKSLLATFTPLIVHLVKNPHAEYEWLNISANLALLKFCCISPTFCEQNLPLLFQSLEQSKSFAVRSNSIIGLGDLIISFNSLIDPHIGFLYSRLRDSNFQVKKITFMVLTFLILNGMVKIKGQISEMAKCLEDPEKRIRDLAKLFFTELSLKDNAIYNNLPDIISNLDCDQTQFRKIMKFIMGFISKSRQTETIIEKLLQRFDHDSERSWEDMAFCISLLSFQTEKSLKKLVDSLPLYQNKLHSDNVYKSFNEIVAKVKSNPKIDKALVDSFRDSIEAARQSCLENYAATTAAVADNSLSTRSPQDRLDLDEEKENDIVENNSTKAKPLGKKLVKVAPKRKIRKKISYSDESD